MLDRIVAYKHGEVAERKRVRPLTEVEAAARSASPVRGFAAAIAAKIKQGKPALIAEVKKASPSKGLIRQDFEPAAIASAYERGGAACLSVLTDAPSFQGSEAYLAAARAACSLPVLRKDFMVDPYQIAESRAMDADCILIIMACTSDALAAELAAAAREFGMDALVEVHDRKELDRALKLDATLIGINNRNLSTFATALETTEMLAPLVPANRIAVAESGISTNADVTRLTRCGARAFLVGESLMRCEDVEAATRALLSTAAV